MTEQEQQLISGLADRIKNAPAPQIDRDAYDLILHTIGTRPDALYVLTQTVLVQEMALNQAKAQIEDLKRQGGYQSSPGGFLPSSNQGSHPSGYQASGYQGSGYAAPPPPSGGGFSGFLHNVATTAAGVIAGEIAFDSLASLFGGNRGGFFGGGSGFMPGSDTTVNNYYNDNPGQGGDDSRFAQAADQDQNISPDIDDERDNSGDSFSGGDDFSGGDSGGSDN
ncbi:MAG TPA: DUF2076 domain-containing protein [Bryobacteraceae bacterium]|jgi:hypothetical protein|nr:DUF2076 domain-containing protein [Bryobacteraceae bacterium]